ncbi:MAG: transporter substrate-binding domain-containing protein [Clostridia bacterium]|nr:transporter substrate-binding domain-containing protein [Clostridia bacterium]
MKRSCSKMKKLLALLTAMLLIMTVFAGCGGADTSSDKSDAAASDLEYIKDKGTLIVGITDYEPMDFQVDGKWTGFDAELAQLVGEKLGVEVKFQLINWKIKETELAGKTIDCIWNGLTWDEERAENMSLTDWYLKNKQAVVINSDNKTKFDSAEELNKATIVAEGGSAGESYIAANFAKATYVDKDDQIGALSELLGKTADAAVIDYIMANYLINKEGSSYSSLMIVDDVVETAEEYYSVAFRKGSDVTAEVNKILKELKDDGTLNTLATKYGLQDALVD